MVPRKCMGFWIIRTLTPEDDSDFLGAMKIRMLTYPPPLGNGKKRVAKGIIGVDNCNTCTRVILRKKCWDCKKIILRY
jgi:hypothetical protein